MWEKINLLTAGTDFVLTYRVAGQMLTKNAFIFIFALGQGPFTHFFTLQC